jgi:hypothetical protein
MSKQAIIDLKQKPYMPSTNASRLTLCKSLFLFCLVGAFLSLSVVAADQPFVVVVIPDSQGYVREDWGKLEMFDAQTKWIADNIGPMNIRAVLHVGDITNNNSPSEWERAKSSLSPLNGLVTWLPCVGNHDFGYAGPAHSLISEYFPESDLSRSPGWGGKMPDENCYWAEFEEGGKKYLLLSLNFGPSDKMLAWADEIIESRPDHRVIMVTHEYVSKDGSLSTKETKKNASFYGKHTDGSRRNTGQEVWDKHVRKHKNYLMVVCGHYDGLAARNEMKGDHGNIVHQMMSNYQYSPRGGNGYLRVLKFLPSENRCEATTFSPFLGESMTDSQNQFSVDLANSAF